MALFEYLKATQRLIHDSKMELVDGQDLIQYVNRARREVAMRTQCLRILTPISGSILTASVVSAGSGYTAPTVSISAPDFPSGTLPFPAGDQATGTVNEIGGSIAAVNITYGGHGYFQ